jgi:hypothetical protein
VSGRVVTVRTVGGLIGDGRAPIVPAPSADLVVTGRTSAGRRLVRYVHADVRGRFRVRLPAGAYSLRPLAGSSLPAPVSVRPGRTTRIELAETLPVTQKSATLEVVE